jgi:hypothetical protein
VPSQPPRKTACPSEDQAEQRRGLSRVTAALGMAWPDGWMSQQRARESHEVETRWLDTGLNVRLLMPSSAVEMTEGRKGGWRG